MKDWKLLHSVLSPQHSVLLIPPARGGQTQPAGEEGEAAEGRDGAEPALAGQAQCVEAPRKDDGARDEESPRL